MKKIVVPLFIILLVILISIGIAAQDLTQPVNKTDTASSMFVVDQGEGVSSVATRLEQEGLIKNRFAFLFEARRIDLGSKLQAGDFRLSKSQTPAEIAQNLTKASLDIWVRTLEGWRAEEVAEVLKKEVPTYSQAWVAELKKNEGYLFPDTYLIPRNADIDQIITIFRNNFDSKITPYKNQLGKNGLSLEQTVILASILEREGNSDDDRPVIAGILLKRMNERWALEADATLQYALGFQKTENTWWKKALTTEDKSIKSAYNTYKNLGLPPAPIASPGISSLKAAFAPQTSAYWFYIHDPQGETHYGRTLEEHNDNVARYL